MNYIFSVALPLHLQDCLDDKGYNIWLAYLSNIICIHLHVTVKQQYIFLILNLSCYSI